MRGFLPILSLTTNMNPAKKTLPTVLRRLDSAARRNLHRLLQKKSQAYLRSLRKKCYCCRQYFDVSKSSHDKYDCMCVACGTQSWEKRNAVLDAQNKIAVVTGARVKIGFACAVRLLRGGAVVIATTRFPEDAVNRFSKQPDFEQWKSRLHVYGLDFRSIRAVEAFIEHLQHQYSHIDYLIQNAAQTIRMAADEYEKLYAIPLENPSNQSCIVETSQPVALLQATSCSNPLAVVGNTGHCDASSVVPLVPPPLKNSWYLKVEEVSTVEFVEVQLVNVTVPFLLCARLKSLLTASRSNSERMYVIHVTAVEGQFSQRSKSKYHVHNNMAKAALNMMTLTIAQDYARERIYVTAVDPGWADVDYRLKTVDFDGRLLKAPLDEWDSAARVLDPILVQSTAHGVLLKDFRSVSW
ncbi:conserved mitochondrial short chain dehydrogenase/reductase family oxidoreductase [Andalucia godoyi]|uniref:Conserved mitochondrial short chain dehydrogenase/reductase family oxidoreductase n=1 Tax=Andalucia godoyi TaxID=505711 RepID=A0A8K0AI81_ANDGO|nr:conserved mitochondrial short chain dehydrogenase/reductase family oxidoreductase [Andalucia godoyi]|eukprot:ANDGO_03715.mRNA.1 conserved mitochondrial short chain dehydrogenase/reductase family oxidoreductase